VRSYLSLLEVGAQVSQQEMESALHALEVDSHCGTGCWSNAEGTSASLIVSIKRDNNTELRATLL
jgi:hypothetical protein